MEKRREEKLSNERVVIPSNKLFNFLDKKISQLFSYVTRF